MENVQNKSKTRKRLIAGFAILAAVAVIGVTNVAGLWSSTATVGAGTNSTFTTGGLSIAADSTTPLSIKLYSGGDTNPEATATDVATANNWRLVPGDKVTVEVKYNVKAQGRDLRVAVTNAAGGTVAPTNGALATSGIVSSNIFAVQNAKAVLSNISNGLTADNVNNVTKLTATDGAGTGDIVVSYDVLFANDGAGATANEGNSYVNGDADTAVAGTRGPAVATLADTIRGIKLLQVINGGF